MGWVPSGRAINDARGPNSTGVKHDQPVAFGSSHKEIAKLILWWKVNYPGIPVVIGKLDLEAAYKWIYYDVKDVASYASEIELSELGLDGSAVIIWLVLIFGDMAAPGNFNIFGQIWSEMHAARVPPDQTWHSSTPYCAKRHVDDMMLIEPLLGSRPWLSRRTAIAEARRVFHVDAINDEKLLTEGKFSTTQKLAGLDTDTIHETFGVPAEWREKFSGVVWKAAFTRGNTTLPLHDVQTLRGYITFAIPGAVWLATEVGVIDRFLGSADSETQLCCPAGAREEAEVLWDELWEVVEWIRIRLEDPEAWTTHFIASFASILSPAELLVVPGLWEGAVALGGDATLDKVCWINWNTKEAAVVSAVRLREALRAHLLADEELIIAILEFFCVLLGVIVLAGQQQSYVAFAYSDNQLTVGWLLTRYSKVRIVRVLLRILAVAEAARAVRVIGVYVRSEHNATADFATRGTDELVQNMFRALTFSLRTDDEAVAALEEWLVGKRSLRLPGVSNRSLDALKTQCHGLENPKLQRCPTPLVAVEVGGRYGVWTRELAQAGCVVYSLPGPLTSAGQDLSQLLDVRVSVGAPKGSCDLLVATLPLALASGAASQVVKAIREWSPKHVCVERPGDADWTPVLAAIDAGLGGHVKVLCNTASQGAALQRARTIVVSSNIGNALGRVLEAGRMKSTPISNHFLPLAAVPADAWNQDDKIWKATQHTKEFANRHGVELKALENQGVVQAATAPLPGPTRVDLEGKGIQVVDDRGGTARARSLTVAEWWQAAGRSSDDLAKLQRCGVENDEIMKSLLREAPAIYVKALVRAVCRLINEEADTRAGAAADATDDRCREALLAWTRAWRNNPQCPSHEYDQWLQKRAESRAGGKRTNTARSEGVVEVLGQASALKAQRKDESKTWLGRLVGTAAKLVRDALSPESLVVYRKAWQQWSIFVRPFVESPFLEAATADQRRHHELLLLLFVTFLSAVMKYAAKMVRCKVAAIAALHLADLRPDPLAGKRALHAALAGLDKREKAAVKKHPATGELLQRMLRNMKLRGFNGLVLIACASIMFTLLLRVGEAIPTAATGFLSKRALTGADIAFCRLGQQITSDGASQADEVVVRTKSAKADQEADGTYRNVYASKYGLCPVWLLSEIARLAPQRFTVEKHLPLFRFRDGTNLTRAELQATLRAAEPNGELAKRVYTHSLRAGGATAMHQVLGDTERVKRWGRWKSEAVQVYIHSVRATQLQLAEKMLAAKIVTF